MSDRLPPVTPEQRREAIWAWLQLEKLRERIAYIDRLDAEGKLPPVPPLEWPPRD